MKFADTFRGLLRRWYIVLPGLLVAASIALGAWFSIPPGYSRSATQLLIPGELSMPEGANPYLFLGGLAPAADVLVRAIGSENVLNEMDEDHPGVEITISRDTTTAGPIIIIGVTARTDEDAEKVLNLLTERTETVLEELQDVEHIPDENRMTVIPVTVDEQSVLEQRNRILVTAGSGIIGVILTLLIAGLVDGFAQQRVRREASSRGDENDENDTVENDIAPHSSSPNPTEDPGPGATAEDPTTSLDQPPEGLSDDEPTPVKPSRGKKR